MSGKPANTDEVAIMRIVSLRLAVGLLGERDAAGWWPSGFMSSTSNAFLFPVFGSRVLQARYQGVTEAARRVHDERIGVGRAFHAFRLPEALEQRIHDIVQSADQEQIGNAASSKDARTTLDALAGSQVDAKEGPALIATVDMLGGTWIPEVAALYRAAFGAGVQCFPYFKDTR